MRILSIGNFGRGWDNSICDEEHIAGALEELGHEVIRHQREDYLITERDYDWVLMAQWDGYEDGLVPYLQRTAPVVYWAFDYQADDQPWHKRLVGTTDLYLSKRIADSKYPNWQWLSQDFAPRFLDRWEEPISIERYEQAPLARDIDVLFTGSYLDWASERNETVKAVGENFNLVIHSVNAWPQRNLGPVMDEGLPELYSRAKVVLSIDHTLEAGYWSDRNAQAMACGAPVLFRYIPLSEARFGDAVTYFYSIEDCLEKIPRFLERYKRRDQYDVTAYRYAQNNLKVINRVQDLLTIVKQYV